MTETCRNCGAEIVVMAQRGSGLCGILCAKADALLEADNAERARNEPECST